MKKYVIAAVAIGIVVLLWVVFAALSARPHDDISSKTATLSATKDNAADIPSQSDPAPEAEAEPDMSSSTEVYSSQSTTSSSVSSKTTINIAGSGTSSTNITINKGGVVTWINEDSVEHTITSDSGGFDSGRLAAGASYSHTFNKPGTYAYYCKLHDNMKGVVAVTD